MIEGWYYIHTNGSLIYKNYIDADIDIKDSDFCIGCWSFDPTDRLSCWSMLVEVLSTGRVELNRILGLAKHWSCTEEDADIFAKRVGCVLKKDGDSWCSHRADFDNFQESLIGFGDTKLEAMAELCKSLSYKPVKIWGATFKSLLELVSKP